MSDTSHTTRRGLLRMGTGAAAYAAAAAVMTAASVGPASMANGAEPLSADRVAWDRAMETYAAASVHFAAADEAYNRTLEAFTKTTPNPAMVDMHAFWPMPRDVALRQNPDALEREAFASENWFPNAAEAARFRRSVDTLREYNRLVEENRRRHGMSDRAEHHDNTCNDKYEAEDALMRLPAPDLAAILWKLERILEIEEGYADTVSAMFVAPVLADVRRFADREGR